MRALLILVLTFGFVSPAFADADADAKAALALALATNKRTADLEARIARLEANVQKQRMGHADVPDVMAPNGFWIRPGAAGPSAPTTQGYYAPSTYYAAPGVVAPAPFVTGTTTRVTTARPVVVSSTSRSVSYPVDGTFTAAPPTGPFGGITINGSGCANGQCGTPEGRGLFGRIFRR